MEKIITAEDISKSYGELKVIDNLTFEVPTGKIYGLIGPNGSGKTTLIKLLTAQEEPDSGTITVGGVDSKNEIELKQKIGILPEKQSPFSFLTPRELFNLVGTVREMDSTKLQEQIDKYSTRLQFTEHLDTLSTDLSRGNQQKVMVTQALLHDPDILFIDEPVANLDPFIQEELLKILREYNSEGNTIVLSTHHLEFAERLCEDSLFISDAGIEQINFAELDKEELLEKF